MIQGENDDVESKKVIDLSNDEAKDYFLKGSSYFNADLPNYINFEPILAGVRNVLQDKDFRDLYKEPEKEKSKPEKISNVNYRLLTNKDGKFAWRPLELIHPVVYVSLVNVICKNENWDFIQKRFKKFAQNAVRCSSVPVVSERYVNGNADQIINWWHELEQQSLIYTLKYSHVLHTDVVDCYGSLYTHSIVWALHGFEEAKNERNKNSLFGNKIDYLIRSGRYGQTNGISQGSTLMDFIAEIVLGYVDEKITEKIKNLEEFQILRYRDDYRIFANSDEQLENILKLISQEIIAIGMKLNPSKTSFSRNSLDGCIKSDKLAAIDLQDLGDTNAKTLQKQLIRLHSFGQRFPNSGALNRFVSNLHLKIMDIATIPDDLEVLVAIATDIGYISPRAFPGIAAILSHLISLAPHKEKIDLWNKVISKMRRVPHNGYLDIWLQRVVQPKAVNLDFNTPETLCQIVNREDKCLWNNDWISDSELLIALDPSKSIIKEAEDVDEVIRPDEIAIFANPPYF